MRPVTHTFSHSVPAPIEQVFALLTDPGRIPDWLPACTEVQSDGPLKQGMRFNVRFGDRVTEFEVVDFARPAAFVWAERGERKGRRMFFRLAGLGESTALTIRDVWMPPSRGAWLHARIWDRRSVQRHLDQIGRRLRSVVTRDGRIWSR
jgi:uncharacterized protein YndB with AHSA1/START domain